MLRCLLWKSIVIGRVEGAEIDEKTETTAA